MVVGKVKVLALVAGSTRLVASWAGVVTPFTVVAAVTVPVVTPASFPVKVPFAEYATRTPFVVTPVAAGTAATVRPENASASSAAVVAPVEVNVSPPRVNDCPAVRSVSKVTGADSIGCVGDPPTGVDTKPVKDPLKVPGKLALLTESYRVLPSKPYWSIPPNALASCSLVVAPVEV